MFDLKQTTVLVRYDGKGKTTDHRTIGSKQAAGDPRAHFTVGDMVDQFEAWNLLQTERTDDKKITMAMHRNYRNDGCKRIVSFFGRSRKLISINSVDFDRFRHSEFIALKKDGEPAASNTIRNRIERCLFVLRWAGDVRLDGRLRTIPFSTGLEFVPPAGKSDDRDRWTKGEFAEMMKVADVKWRAACLMALNCCFQNVDIEDLKLDQIHLDRKIPVHNQPRKKPKGITGKKRAAVLWPETVAALKEWLKIRPEPKTKEDAAYVFLKDDGSRYTQLGLEFVKIRPEGLPDFQLLRHSFFSTAIGKTESGDSHSTRLYIAGKGLGKDVEPYLTINKKTLLAWDLELVTESVERVRQYYIKGVTLNG